jgi:outer membrane protein assembly factor BamB
VDDYLIFSRDGADISEITALDANTGEIAWQTERDIAAQKTFSFCTPLLIEANARDQLILPGSNVVQSVDPTSGKEIWRVTYDGFSVIPRPVYESGLVFVCTGFMRASLLAIDPSGSGDVTQTHVNWQSKANIPRTPSLVAFDGKIGMVSDNGVASCFDALSGKEVWKERIGGNFSASPILAGKHLYLISEDGHCTVLNVAHGVRKVAENRLNERTLASPAVVGRDLLIRTSAALYRISNEEL